MRPVDLMTQIWQGQCFPFHQMLMADTHTQTAQLMSSLHKVVGARTQYYEAEKKIGLEAIVSRIEIF